MPVHYVGPVRLFVGGMPMDIVEAEFRKHFAAYGKIAEARLVEGQRGRFRGFGTVTFKDRHAAEDCLRDHHQHKIRDKWIDVKFDEKFTLAKKIEGKCGSGSSQAARPPTAASVADKRQEPSGASGGYASCGGGRSERDNRTDHRLAHNAAAAAAAAATTSEDKEPSAAGGGSGVGRVPLGGAGATSSRNHGAKASGPSRRAATSINPVPAAEPRRVSGAVKKVSYY